MLMRCFSYIFRGNRGKSVPRHRVGDAHASDCAANYLLGELALREVSQGDAAASVVARLIACRTELGVKVDLASRQQLREPFNACRGSVASRFKKRVRVARH
jgi:hypothetical protein